MAKMLGGGKVLYYDVQRTRETIIVSKIADNRITLICGPQASGKTTKAEELAANHGNRVFRTDYGWLIGGECIVPDGTEMVIIDEFPHCGKFSLLLSAFLSEKTCKALLVHVVALVQMQFKGFEPAFLYGHHFKTHPVQYITT